MRPRIAFARAPPQKKSDAGDACALQKSRDCGTKRFSDLTTVLILLFVSIRVHPWLKSSVATEPSWSVCAPSSQPLRSTFWSAKLSLVVRGQGVVGRAY